MKRMSGDAEKQGPLSEWEKEELAQYEYSGYQIRVHFTGDKTLAQCLKALAERRMEE